MIMDAWMICMSLKHDFRDITKNFTKLQQLNKVTREQARLRLKQITLELRVALD